MNYRDMSDELKKIVCYIFSLKAENNEAWDDVIQYTKKGEQYRHDELKRISGKMEILNLIENFLYTL